MIFVFLDMFRADGLNIYNNNNKESDFDRFLKSIGGVAFTNTYTPTPDTNRSFSSFLSGVPAFFNGCQKKGSSIKNLKYDTFFSLLLNRGYDINLCMYHSFRINLFPEDILLRANILEGNNIFDQISNLSIKENSLTFIDLPDAHLYVNDYLSFPSAEKKYNKIITETLESINSKINFDSFDFVVFFSDHGHSNYFDPLHYPKTSLLDSRRARILMQIKYKKKFELFSVNHDLHSITDLYDTVFELLDSDSNRINPHGNVSFLSNQARKYIIFEEMFEWYLGANQIPEVWACLTPEGYYQIDRNLFELKRGDFTSSKEILFYHYPEIDNYLKDYSHFDNLRSSNNLNSRSTFSNGVRRLKPLKYRLIDYFVKFIIPNKLKSLIKKYLTS